MIILDAYAVLAYLRGEPCAGQVAGLLREPTVLTAVNAAEVVDQLLAGRLRARHYERNTTAVSLADCIAAATALTRAHPLATADPALATVIRQEGGTVHALPDSRGRLPQASLTGGCCHRAGQAGCVPGRGGRGHP